MIIEHSISGRREFGCQEPWYPLSSQGPRPLAQTSMFIGGRQRRRWFPRQWYLRKSRAMVGEALHVSGYMRGGSVWNLLFDGGRVLIPC